MTSRTVLEKRIKLLREKLIVAQMQIKTLGRNGRKPRKLAATHAPAESPSTIDNELMRVLGHVAARSLRGQLRAVAAYLAIRQEHKPSVPREVLRAYCKTLRIYDTATFSYYMADERHAKAVIFFVEVDGGWNLTEAGTVEALRLFPPRTEQ